MPQETFAVRLTMEQIALLRKLITERCFMLHKYPLPEDGDELQRLHEVDKPLHFIHSACS